jgi:Cu(I)/Ag(I) efflux system membrane fusion protein/cobalt-zinc-cadmium efflux system membrane fusion protein
MTGRERLKSLAWVLLGATLATVVFANPLGFAWLDALRHLVLGDRRVMVQGTLGPEQNGQLWTCGMHPQIVQSEPGTCPICQMRLVPLRAGNGAPAGEREVLLYRNPMDPSITSPVPAKDSMGMDYVPVYAEELAGGSGQAATVRIDPAVVQNMNVVTRRVDRGDLVREIRTVGYLEYDQQRMVTVTTKFSGFIETVYVNYVGEPVRKGQPLFEIYSPELVQTEQELLSAIAFAERLQDADPGTRRRAEGLVEAARRRLAYWDITREQVAKLESTREVVRTLTVAAPAGGVVMMRMPGLEGMAARPGMELFHVADLSSLWLSVEAFEDQIAWLAVGSEADVSLSYFPGETFSGRVRYIEPQVNEKTRTVPLKLEVPNRDGRLRAGMYATVRFRPVVARDAVIVPEMAVLRTGQRNLVVVAEGGGRFTPREVELGGGGDGNVAVVSGLAGGEWVVTSSQFLIDSESNLKEAVQKLLAGRDAAKPERTPAATPGTAPEHGH